MLPIGWKYATYHFFPRTSKIRWGSYAMMKWNMITKNQTNKAGQHVEVEKHLYGIYEFMCDVFCLPAWMVCFDCRYSFICPSHGSNFIIGKGWSCQRILLNNKLQIFTSSLACRPWKNYRVPKGSKRTVGTSPILFFLSVFCSYSTTYAQEVQRLNLAHW